MNQEKLSDEYWLNRLYRKSESKNTKLLGVTALRTFDQFCQYEYGMNGKSQEQMIEKYQNWFNQDKPDIRSICMSLDKFVNFMGEDHDEIELPGGGAGIRRFKAKTPKTILSYFGLIKSYLRICHGIKLSTEDIRDYVQFPRNRKEARRAITIDTLKILFGKCSPEQRALYYVLVTSGMRLGEVLALKKSNFHLDENPVRITILADDTKTKEGRETYITSEALEKIKPVFDKKGDNEYLFHDHDNVFFAVRDADRYFHRLRERTGLTEKYPNSIRYVVNIHSFRAYFHTKASQKHGPEYANALDGHGAYLKQYYREDPKERAEKYLTLEPSLLIESVKTQADQTKDQIIETLESQMDELRNKMKRIELLNQ